MARRETGAFAFAFGHDGLDQLASVNYSGSIGLPTELVDRSFSYSSTGNRSDQTFIANVPTGDANHQLKPDQDGQGRLTQKIDRLTGNVETYSYRVDGKIASYLNGATLVKYHYDALGRRVSKEVSGNMAFTQAYSHLENRNQILLSRGGDGATRTHLDGQGLNEHLGFTSSSGVKGYETDHLGSVLNTEAAGTAASFSPWGELLSSPPQFSLSSNPLMIGHAGAEFDSESGLYAYLERHRSPTSGFLQRDPIGFFGGDVNDHRYVGNGPVEYVDPTGLWKLPATPAGPGPNWKPVPEHQDPNGGSRYLDPNGRTIEFNPGKPGAPGSQGVNHWHDVGSSGSGRVGGEKVPRGHYLPGEELPNYNEPKSCPAPRPGFLSVPWLPGPLPIIINPYLLEPSLAPPERPML